MEIKIAAARLLKCYTIEKSEKTPDHLPTHINALTSPSKGVFVTLKKRNKLTE